MMAMHAANSTEDSAANRSSILEHYFNSAEAKHSPAFIPKESVDRLCAACKCTNQQLLLYLLPFVAQRAEIPTSDFRVACVALCASDNIYMGVNVEFANCPLNYSVHAEQCVISNVAVHGEKKIKAIGLTHVPCGHCRQFMKEMNKEEELDIFVDKRGCHRLAELLPLAFTPRDLGKPNDMLVPQPVEMKLCPSESADADNNKLAASKLKHAWAPYSACPSVVVLRSKDGRLFAGVYLESCAYNPSLAPLQAAFAQAVLAGLKWPDISHVYLYELENASTKKGGVSHHSNTASMVKIVAPDARYHLLNFSM